MTRPRFPAPLGLALALGLALPLSAQPAAPPAPTKAEARGAARALFAEGAFEEQHERDPSRAQVLYRRALERARAASLRALAREAEAAIARCDAKLGRATQQAVLPPSAYLFLERLQTKWERSDVQQLLRYGERLIPSLVELVIEGRTFGPEGKRYLLPPQRCAELLRGLHDSPAKERAIQRLLSHADAMARSVGLELLDQPRHLERLQRALASPHEVERIAALHASSTIYRARPLPSSLIAAVRSAVVTGTEGAHNLLLREGPTEQLWLAEADDVPPRARRDAVYALVKSVQDGKAAMKRALPCLIQALSAKDLAWGDRDGLIEHDSEEIATAVAAEPTLARQLERFLLTLPRQDDKSWSYRSDDLRNALLRLRESCASLLTLEACLRGEDRDPVQLSAAVRNLAPSPAAPRMLEQLAATPRGRLRHQDWATILSSAARFVEQRPEVFIRLLELVGERLTPAEVRRALGFRLTRPAPALARRLEAALLKVALGPAGQTIPLLTDVAGVPTFSALLQRSPDPELDQLNRIVEQLPPEAYPDLRAAVEQAPARARPAGVLALLQHSNPRLSRGEVRIGLSPEECDARQAQDLRWLDAKQRRAWGSRLLYTLRAGSLQQQALASDLAHDWEELPLDLLCEALSTLSEHRPQQPSFPLLETLTESLGKAAGRKGRGHMRLVELWQREAELSPSHTAEVVSASFGALLRESPPAPLPQARLSPRLRAWLTNPAMFFALRDPVAAFERHLPALAQRRLVWPITRLFLVQIGAGERERETLRLFVPAWSHLEAWHRRELLNVVAAAPTRVALPLVERGLAEIDVKVRQAAERALERLGARRRLEEELAQQRTGIADATLRELVELLDAEQDSVAVAAAQALGKLGRAETLPLLIRKLGTNPRSALKRALEDAISAISSAAQRPDAR